MAPSEESYFPSLETCLSGNCKLITWKSAIDALCGPLENKLNLSFIAFLSCDDSVRLLKSATVGFPKPSLQSKSDLETRTAAINVAPSSHGHYDVEEIKKDALWLSQEADVNEVEALRIATVEWQNRPKYRLLEGFSENEQASLHEVLGPVSSSGPFNRLLGKSMSRDAPNQFLSAARRRSRLLTLYLEERRSLLGTCEKLVCIALAKSALPQTSKRGVKGADTGPNADKSLEELGRSIFEQIINAGTENGLESHVLSCIEIMQSRINSLEHGNDWHKSEGEEVDVEKTWVMTHIYELTVLSDFLLLSLRSSRRIPNSSIVLPWFHMLSRYEFFGGFQPQSYQEAQLVNLLQISAVTTSIALLDPATSTSYLLESQGGLQVEQDVDENIFYFFDRNAVGELQEIFFGLAGACTTLASPAVFAWGIVLYTIRELGLSAKETRERLQVQKTIDQGVTNDHQHGRRLSSSSVGSVQQSIYEDVLDHARAASLGEDPVGFLTRSALDGCHVFDVIADIAAGSAASSCPTLPYWRHMALLELVKVSLVPIGYTPEILTATLAILDHDGQSIHVSQTPEKSPKVHLASAFMSDELLMTNIVDISMARFPYEALPFLRLCKALAAADCSDDTGRHFIAERLASIGSFTQVVRRGFSGYHTVREDENANLVSLEQSLDMCAPSSSTSLSSSVEIVNADDVYCIPSGTIGQVISDSRPTVIMWYHKYPGLSFLGKWLELYQRGQEVDFMSQADPSDTIASAIIQLFTSLIVAADREDACSLLEEASNGLDRNSDIVLIIFEIFEQQIQSLRFKRAADGAISTSVVCAQFMSAMISILPGRIWPLLARSSFLNLNGGDSLLLATLSVDPTVWTLRFLETSVELYTRLLEDAIACAIPQIHHNKPRDNNRLTLTIASGSPSHVMTRVMLAFTQATAELYDSLSSLQFRSTTHQARVRTNITKAFRRLLLYAFGIDDSVESAAKLTSIISMAALYLLDFFRPDSPGDTNLGTILQVLAYGLQEQDSLNQENLPQAKIEQTNETLWLCYDLIRGARLKHAVTFLERQLCRIIPVLLRLYGMHTSHELPCLKVMSELIAVGSISETDSSSLLSFLGTGSSKSLLEMLSMFQKTPSDTESYVATWTLLTALLSVRQQWFAIYMLTGVSPKRRMKDGKSDLTQQSSDLRGKPFLAVALDELSHIESMEGECATATLSFVCRAQENWSWTTSSLQSHPDFVAGIMSYVGKMNLKQSSALQQCYQHKIAALAAELCIVYLHYARSNRDYSIIKKMLPAFKWYTANAVKSLTYNSSLQSSLRRNFKARYPSCGIINFKKTGFCSSNYGKAFFYDIQIAAKMLSLDPSWTGTSRCPGFAHELELANLNLSLVDSQLLLLHSFKALCIEHSAFFVRDREVQKLMAQIVQNCLAANSQTCPAEKMFEILFETRIELTVALLQRLVSAKARGSEFSTILVTAWETTRFRNGNYDAAVSNNDVSYYRSCLTALLLCIQLHLDKHHTSLSSHAGQTLHASTHSTILEILSTVVGQGVDQVSSALYDQAQSQRTNPMAPDVRLTFEVGVPDFFLLLSILQSSLRLPTLDHVAAQVSSAFISGNIIDATLRLYSWSHRLSPPDTDPVYSSCALSFLVALSTLPPVAEELGIQGVLNRLATSRITLNLQNIPDGVGPFDLTDKMNQYPRQQRLYTVWCEGTLPLCLNLLHSVGRPMAAEIASFLNQFPKQLVRASNAFTYNPAWKDHTTGSVSLSLAAEATTLALISHILSCYRIAGASAGVDSFDISVLTRYDEPENKKALKADVEELLNRKSFLRSRIMVTSEKELLWAKTKPAGGVDAMNVLEEKIVAELGRALVCLQGNDAGEEGS